MLAVNIWGTWVQIFWNSLWHCFQLFCKTQIVLRCVLKARHLLSSVKLTCELFSKNFNSFLPLPFLCNVTKTSNVSHLVVSDSFLTP